MRAWASLLCALWLCVGALRAAGVWRHDAYVWQRRHDGAVAAALAAQGGSVTGYYPLAAEVSWTESGRAEVVRVAVDHAALAAAGRPVGPVLRIGPFPGPFARDDAVARSLVALARDVLAEARRGGVEPAELQVDFDCAERSLAGYREWLEALREATGDTPLVFTALPAWLRHEAEFAALARAADGFVLQVHSLEKPSGGPDAAYSLCDPERALAWAEEASRAGGGRPFRVALPTYGYRLAFDARGEFFALSAEGPEPARPAGTRVRVVGADPAEMLGLERALAARPPAGCVGVVWFRLPVAGDRLNWDAATFARVLAGEAPRARLEAGVRWTEPRLAEIVVENRGETSEPLPGRVGVSWASGAEADAPAVVPGGAADPGPDSDPDRGAGPRRQLVASDGLGGYEVMRRGSEAKVELRGGPETMDIRLAPGKSRRIAWLRFSDETFLEVTLPAAVVP